MTTWMLSTKGIISIVRTLGTLILILLVSVGGCSKRGGDSSFSPNLPQPDTAYLDGFILDSSDKPLSDVIITVSDLNNNPLDETITNDEGYFRFDVDPGEDYRIDARYASGSGGQSWEYYAQSGDNADEQNPDSDEFIEGSIGGIKIWIPSGGMVYSVPPDDDYLINPGTGVGLKYSIRAANSMLKILPSTDLNTLDVSMRVKAAKGEHEAFQLVPKLNDSVSLIRDVEVTASDLVKGQDRISNEYISLYLEHYVEVTIPTDAGGAVGYWPDALAPLTDPFDVSASFPSPIWVDIEIPRSASPGEYRGDINFKSEDGGNYMFHYVVEVWNITLPKQLYIKANIGLDQEDIAAVHNLPTGLGTTAGRQKAREYASFLADRHIATHGIPLYQPTITLNPDSRSYTLNFSETLTDINTFLSGYDHSNFMFPLNRFDCMGDGFIARGEEPFTPDFNARFQNYLEQVSTFFSTRGYLNRGFMFMVDEPNSLEDYNLVRSWSNLIHQASIYPDYMVTEQPAPDNPEWGTLHNYVDIFTMCTRVLKYADESLIREGAENKEEWIYTNTNVYPYPSIAIDRQGVELRLFLWFVYQHEFRGMFYSSANDWTIANPWENPMTYDPSFGNGCSSLLYPGTMCNQYTGQNNVNGPVTSIRLELIRDGLEDAHLLYLLGHGNPVSIADELMTSWTDYTDDPAALIRVRENIANAIMGVN